MKRLALLGVACYLLALLIVFPAPLALRWFAPDALAVQGPTGSIWRGEAQAASYDGYYLGKLHWSMRPLDLFRARVAYHLEAQGPNGFVDGVFALTPVGNLHISTPASACTGAAPVSVLMWRFPTGVSAKTPSTNPFGPCASR